MIQLLSWLLLVCMMGMVVFLANEDSKNPIDEEIVFTTQRNLATGRLNNVEIVRCKKCGQTISFIECDQKWHPIGGYVRNIHHCGHVWGHQELPGAQMAFFQNFNLLQFLDKWQTKLSRALRKDSK